MARVGAACAAQNKHRTAFILILEKKVFWYTSWSDLIRSEPLLVELLDFIGGFEKNFGTKAQNFSENKKIFGKVFGMKYKKII